MLFWNEIYICKGCGKNIAEEMNTWQVLSSELIDMPHLVCVLRTQRQKRVDKFVQDVEDFVNRDN